MSQAFFAISTIREGWWWWLKVKEENETTITSDSHKQETFAFKNHVKLTKKKTYTLKIIKYVKMSGAEFEREFLYNLPASVMSHFTRVMDSLSHSDWILFGKNNLFIFRFLLWWCCFHLFNSKLRGLAHALTLTHEAVWAVTSKVQFVKCLFIYIEGLFISFGCE